MIHGGLRASRYSSKWDRFFESASGVNVHSDDKPEKVGAYMR